MLFSLRWSLLGMELAVRATDRQQVHLQSLLPILQRIGDGSTSEQGLEELYRFMKDHPQVTRTTFRTVQS